MHNTMMAKFASVPCLVAPEMAERFEGYLRTLSTNVEFGKLMNEQAEHAANDNEDGFWFAADDWRAQYRPYIVKDGVLHIPVKGVLLNHFAYSFGSWATGYQYIGRALARGLADENVKGIALITDSPGGEVSGVFHLANKIYEGRSIKPIRAIVDEHSYSAAYLISSAANKIVVANTGGVGSIGVVTMHIDVTKALEKEGVKVTLIYAGKHKVDSYPYKELTKEAQERIQGRIDRTYGIFVADVARNRGMDEQAVRDTEALTFHAEEAVSNGLADSIGSLDDATADFVADLAIAEGEDTMDPKDKAAADQAATDKLVADARTEGHAAGVAEGKKVGMAEGATAERNRVKTIMTSPEALTRPKAAQSAALNTNLTVEEASAFLKDAAEEKAVVTTTTTTAQSPLEKAMESNKGPELGAPAAEETASQTSRKDAAFAMLGKPNKAA